MRASSRINNMLKYVNLSKIQASEQELELYGYASYIEYLGITSVPVPDDCDDFLYITIACGRLRI